MTRTARDAQETLVIGDPSIAGELRDALVRNGLPAVSIVTSPWALRRRLVLDSGRSIVLCIALDERTIRRFGSHVRSLLADDASFPGVVRSVGLYAGFQPDPWATRLGCNVYVESGRMAAHLCRLMHRDASRLVMRRLRSRSPSQREARFGARLSRHAVSLPQIGLALAMPSRGVVPSRRAGGPHGGMSVSRTARRVERPAEDIPGPPGPD
jgi:hypothetical protein